MIGTRSGPIVLWRYQMESPRLAWGQGSSDLLGIRPFLTWIFGHCLLFYQDSLHPFDTDHGSFGDPLWII